MRNAPTGCPFAPRCAWRIEACWTANPALRPLADGERVVMTGPGATHRIACHNPPTANEVRGGRPLRPGFTAAPPPAGMLDELSSLGTESTADLEGLIAGIEAEEGPLSLYPERRWPAGPARAGAAQ